ncbi:MAG: hypothetical protein RMI49_02840 [Candidatus Caldarchaeum sp.]|nr:hypothetical protein [Candidatus Caldarchaeum sp.]
MPKKVIVRIKPSSQPPQQEQPPEIEAVPPQTPVEKHVEAEKTPVPVEEPPPQQQTDNLEEVLRMYDELMREAETIKNLDRNFVLYCIKAEDLRPQLVRSILERFSKKRNALLEKSGGVLQKLKSVREVIGSEFAEVEEELIWSSIELNTMQLESNRGDKNVGLKEELEARIPELRKRLATLRNRLKMVDDMVKQLTDLPRNIVDLTTSKDEVAKLLEDVKKKMMITHGQNAEAYVRAEIEKIAQRESIPREYATILLWRQVVGR